MDEMSENKTPEHCGNAPYEILHSIALEEAALSHILNAEGEKIQKAVATNDISIENLLCINNSVAKTIREVTGLELVLLSKLEAVCSRNWKPTPPPTHIYGCISICVFDCKTKESLSGAEICITKNNKLVAKGCTDHHGKYTSEPLPFGCYCVNIKYKDQEKKLCNIEVKEHSCNDLKICLDVKDPCPTPIVPKHINISGQVTDKCGRPLANVCVHAKGLNSVSVYTNQCGYYEICQLLVSDCFYITPKCDSRNGIDKQFNSINKSCFKTDFIM